MEPMQLEISTEIELLMISLLVGAGMGVVYDVIRAFRAVFRHAKAAVFAEDFVYALLFGSVFFIYCTALTNGIRGFVVIGMLIGCVVESLTLGRAIRYLTEKVFLLFSKIAVFPMVKIARGSANQICKRSVKKSLKFYKDDKKAKKALESEI